MKLHVASDLHLETLKSKEIRQVMDGFANANKTGVDTLVLAGDICCIRVDRWALMKKSLKEFGKMYPNVVYIPGNHEFWGGSIYDSEDKWREVCGEVGNLTILRPSSPVTLCGQKWYGGPLFYNVATSYGHFIDFSRITSGAQSIQGQFDEFVAGLDDSFNSDIVVSHHFPTEESIAPEWIGYRNNDFFCSKIEDRLVALKNKPKLWIHGHTHNPFDYISRTGIRMYANPLGYEMEGLNPDFWNRLEVTV